MRKKYLKGIGISLVIALIGACSVASMNTSNASFLRNNGYKFKTKQITVLSQNLRAQSGKDGYNNTIVKRAPRLYAELAKYDTDIKCFQECSIEWKANIDKELNMLEYECIYEFNNKKLCNPIYVKKSRFKVLDSGSFIMTEDSSAKYDESRVASWVEVMDKNTGKTLTMLNAHLATERKRQVTSCEKIMSKVLDIGSDAYLICGDFNFSSNSSAKGYNGEAYQLMMNLGAKDMALAAASEGVQKITGTTFHGFGNAAEEDKQRIDFFFGSQNLNSDIYSLVKDMYKGEYVSDHWGLINYISIN